MIRVKKLNCSKRFKFLAASTAVKEKKNIYDPRYERSLAVSKRAGITFFYSPLYRDEKDLHNQCDSLRRKRHKMFTLRTYFGGDQRWYVDSSGQRFDLRALSHSLLPQSLLFNGSTAITERKKPFSHIWKYLYFELTWHCIATLVLKASLSGQFRVMECCFI